MEINKFQQNTARTIKEYQDLSAKEAQVLDMSLGLGGEAGEVQDLIKHSIFHHEPLDRSELAKEIGDVMWYACRLASIYNISMDTILKLNEAKLAARYVGGYSDQQSANRHQTEFVLSKVFKELEALENGKNI